MTQSKASIVVMKKSQYITYDILGLFLWEKGEAVR